MARKAEIPIILSNGKQAGQTINELRQQANRLNKEINNLKPGSEEFVNASKDFNKIADRLKEVRSEVKNTQESSSGLVDTFMEFIPFSGQIQSVSQAIKGVNLGLKGTRAALIATGIGAFIVLLGSVIAYFTQFQEGINFVNTTLAGLKNVLNELIGRLGNFAKGLWEIINGNFSKGTDMLSASFDNLGGSIKAAFNEGRDMAMARIELEKFIRSQEVAAAKLDALSEKNRAIADDATRSFKEREEAAERVRKTSEKLAQLNFKIAKQELDIINQEVAAAERQGILNDELSQKRVDAQVKVIEKEKESMMVFLENEKQRRELVQDRLERDLDILIDGFDNYKTINEKIIESDKLTFSERSKRLDELQKLGQDSFTKQVETIQEFTGKQLDAYDLLNTADAEQLNNKIRNLELSEIIEGRLLEVIRERRIVLADFAEFERNIIEQRAQMELDAQRNIQDLKIAIMEEGIQKEVEKIWLDADRKIEALVGSEAQITEQRRLIEEERLQNIQAIQNKYLEQEMAQKDALIAKERERQMQAQQTAISVATGTASALGGIFGNLAGLQEEGSKSYKSFAQIQARMAAFQAAINAYQSTAAIPVVGPALAPVAAATALAFGMKQASMIGKQNPGTPSGGGGVSAGGASISGLNVGAASTPPRIETTATRTNRPPVASGAAASTSSQESSTDRLIEAFENRISTIKVINSVQDTREGINVINSLEDQANV